jgi:anti-sigma B factor antagonist
VTIKDAKEGGHLVLELQGDFRGGAESFTELRRKGHEALAECPFLALDCKHVAFLDSQTLGLLVELMRAAHVRGGELYLVNVTERVGRWFELSGLDRIFKIMPEGETPGALEPVPPPEERREMLDSVDIDHMVTELREALGEADESGAPSSPGPGDEKMLSEIRKLITPRQEESD